MSSMPSTGPAPLVDPEPSELLHYLPAYKVVVCVTCQYAVQPHAIPRHLKDIHHIHRARRRPFIQYVSKLALDEPQKVIESSVSQFPVPLLPVQDGLSCEHDGCAHLCVSEKRMKSHWLSVHKRPCQAVLDWKSVRLQTFFRGNLLRYFTDYSVKDVEPPSKAYAEVLESANELQRSNMLDEPDVFLLRHYITSTSITIAHDKKSEALWQVTVPQLAYRHSFLLHGILACSALHLAYENPPQHQHYFIQASSHQSIATPAFRTAIENVNEDNCHSVMAFSHLMVISSFVLERQDERLLIVEENGSDVLPSWLHFLRNGCVMVCAVWDQIEAGPAKDLAEQWEVPGYVPDHCPTDLEKYLLSVIPSQDSPDAWSEETCQVYSETTIALGGAFSCAGTLGDRFTTWDALRVWPFSISMEFMKLLSNRHPSALILLAHYCILLKKVESNWYFEGRATKLLSTIVRRLDRRWHVHIRWPLEEIGISSSAV